MSSDLATLFFFLTLSFKRLRSQVGLAAVLVASVALAIGIAVCVPVFADAVSRTILQQELRLAPGSAHRSTVLVRFYASPSASHPLAIADADVLRPWLASVLVGQTGVPLRAVYTEVHSPRYQMIARPDSAQLTPERIDGIYVIYADRVEDHVQVIGGAPFGDGEAEGMLPVWINQETADEHLEGVPGVEAAMPVGEYKASIVAGDSYIPGRLLAIDRSRFPRIAYYRPDYSAQPLGELMNRLAATDDGMLVPASIAEGVHLSAGDRLRVNVVIEEQEQHTFEFALVGTFDYFPTMFPGQGAVFVANLDYLQLETSGLVAYGVWVRAAPGADVAEIKRAIISRSGATLEPVGDLPTALAEDGARLERVGLFGMLTISFVAGALLAAAGFAVHVSAAMRKRGVRFAVLQALGVSRGQVLGTLFLEYAVALAYGLLAGSGLGALGARLYVPFYQIVETRDAPVPPYFVLIDGRRGLELAGLVAVALIVAQGMALLRLLQSHLFETLRLGMHQ